MITIKENLKKIVDECLEEIGYIPTYMDSIPYLSSTAYGKYIEEDPLIIRYMAIVENGHIILTCSEINNVIGILKSKKVIKDIPLQKDNIFGDIVYEEDEPKFIVRENEQEKFVPEEEFCKLFF